MKLNQLPNLRTEDFPSEQSWISKLFTQLNPFIQSVNLVLDNNIDYSTNIKSITRDYTITTFQSFSFQWTFTDSQPIDLRIVQAYKGTQLTPTILLPAWSYDATNRVVTVSQLVEVTSAGVAALSGRYQFKVRASV